FPDEKQASDSAAALERRDFAAKPDNQPLAIPKYADAHAHWEPGKQAMSACYASGKFVIVTSTYDQAKNWFHKVDLPAMIALTGKALDTDVPAIAKFTPHPPDKLTDQPIDDEGMLGRTMVRPKEAHGEWLNPPGVYKAHAALNFFEDQAETRKWFDADGVDKWA